MNNKKEKAIFAGGCFWCMVKPFDQWDGVYEVQSGYTGGTTENPTYDDVKTGETGHYEAVQITYNPQVISYNHILELYWRQIDPTDDGGQFHDRGSQYRTAIFYQTEEQRMHAENSKNAIQLSGKFNKPIVTNILPASTFYPAEEFHQNFYKKSEKEYVEDRKKSGRDEFIHLNWN